jgi:hypothetical protein
VGPGAPVGGQRVDPVLPGLEVIHPRHVGAEGEVVAQVVEDLELADTDLGVPGRAGDREPDEADIRTGEQVHRPPRGGSVAGLVGDRLPPAGVGRGLDDVPVHRATVREDNPDLA